MAEFLNQYLGFMGAPEVATSAVVGFIVGFIYLAQRWAPDFDAPLTALLAGEGFLLPLAVARWFDGSPTWERTWSVATLWVLFTFCLWLGIRVRCQFFSRP